MLRASTRVRARLPPAAGWPRCRSVPAWRRPSPPRRAAALGEFHRLPPVAGLADDLDVGLRGRIIRNPGGPRRGRQPAGCGSFSSLLCAARCGNAHLDGDALPGMELTAVRRRRCAPGRASRSCPGPRRGIQVGEAPPLSAMVSRICRLLGEQRIRTRLAPECRATLVSASWAMRNRCVSVSSASRPEKSDCSPPRCRCAA